MKIKDSAKKIILAMVLGLGLACSSVMSVHALSSNTVSTNNQLVFDGGVSQLQSINDSVTDGENPFEKYGGCGLSCAGCSVKCF